MADNERLDYQQIEEAFRVPAKVLEKLGDSTEARESKRLLDLSNGLAYHAREKQGPYRETEIDDGD